MVRKNLALGDYRTRGVHQTMKKGKDKYKTGVVVAIGRIEQMKETPGGFSFKPTDGQPMPLVNKGERVGLVYQNAKGETVPVLPGDSLPPETEIALVLFESNLTVQ